jgi:hypothetical protein
MQVLRLWVRSLKNDYQIVTTGNRRRTVLKIPLLLCRFPNKTHIISINEQKAPAKYHATCTGCYFFFPSNRLISGFFRSIAFSGHNSWQQ